MFYSYSSQLHSIRGVLESEIDTSDIKEINFTQCFDTLYVRTFTYSSNTLFSIRRGTGSGPSYILQAEEISYYLDYTRLIPVLFNLFIQYNPSIISVSIELGTTGLFSIMSNNKINDFKCTNIDDKPFENINLLQYFRATPSQNPSREIYITSVLVYDEKKIFYIGIPVYIEEKFHGAILAMIDLDSALEPYYNFKPSTNGHYIICNKYGEILYLENDTTQFIFEEYSFFDEIVENGLTLNDTKQFSIIYKSILSKNFDQQLVNAYGLRYQIKYSTLIRNLIYFVAIVPENDITVNGRWYSSQSSVVFYYSTTDETANTTIILHNNASYNVDFNIVTNDAFTFNPQYGTIYPSGKTSINVMAYMTLTTLPALVINSVGDETASCFEYLALDVSKVIAGNSLIDIIDCLPSDYKYNLNRCDGLMMRIDFKWADNKTCFGGLNLPSAKKITCSKYAI